MPLWKLHKTMALKKQFILFIASAILLTAFFILPQNMEWGKDRIIAYYQEFQYQRNHLERETRMRDRFVNAYILSKNIADELKKRNAGRKALVLVPPTGYFKNKGVDYPVPWPAVFYYYTGINSTWCHFKNARDANWYVRVDNGKLVVDSVISELS